MKIDLKLYVSKLKQVSGVCIFLVRDKSLQEFIGMESETYAAEFVVYLMFTKHIKNPKKMKNYLKLT